MTTKDEKIPQNNKTFGHCLSSCPRYRRRKKNISMLNKTDTSRVCSPCGFKMLDQSDLFICDNLVKTSRMSTAKYFDENEQRINTWLAKSQLHTRNSLDNGKKVNLKLKMSQSESHKKSEKSKEPYSDITLPKLTTLHNNSLTSQNNSLLPGQPFFQQHESRGNYSVYETLPRIKKVHDETSLTEKRKRTYEYVSMNRRRVSCSKLINNLQGKYEERAKKDEKPELEDKKKEKIDHKPKLKDKSILSDNSKIEKNSKLGDKAQIGDETKKRDKAQRGDRTKIEDKAKIVNKANLNHKPNLKDKSILSYNFKIEEKTKLGNKAQIGDETKQGDKTQLRDRTKIEDKANIEVNPKLDRKLQVENKAKPNLKDKSILRNESKIEDKTKLGNKAQIGSETKQGNKTQFRDRTKIEDKVNIEVKPKLDRKLQVDNKAEVEYKYSIGHYDEKLCDTPKKGDNIKNKNTPKREQQDSNRIMNQGNLPSERQDNLPQSKKKVDDEKNYKATNEIVDTPESVKKDKLSQKIVLTEQAILDKLIELAEKHDKMMETVENSESEKEDKQSRKDDLKKQAYLKKLFRQHKKELQEKAKRERKQQSPIVHSPTAVAPPPPPTLESYDDDKIIASNHDKDNDETGYVILGNKIFKQTKLKINKCHGHGHGSLPQHQTVIIKTDSTNATLKSKPKKENHKRGADYDGVIHFALSNRKFIDMGWTKLPSQKVVRKINVYRMRPSHPEFDWFTKNKGKGQVRYNSGEALALLDDDGRGRWFYRDGNLALDYYNAEELNANQRYVVYSSEGTDERGRLRPQTVLATFDHLGNGVVFDHSGKVRLKYNQSEGVVLDRSIGPESHWKWHALNDPPVLQHVMIDTQMPFKDPRIESTCTQEECHKAKENQDMLAIEFNNYIRDKGRKITQSYKPYQIKMKAMKINKNFSLRILNQATVYLIYRDGTTSMKLNIGMTLDPTEILDTVTCDLGDVCNTLEKFPARTESIATLQRVVAQAQDVERARVRREQRLRPPVPSASADRLRAGLSFRRQPLVTNSSPDINMAPCDAVTSKCAPKSTVVSKPCSFNIYCDITS